MLANVYIESTVSNCTLQHDVSLTDVSSYLDWFGHCTFAHCTSGLSTDVYSYLVPYTFVCCKSRAVGEL